MIDDEGRTTQIWQVSLERVALPTLQADDLGSGKIAGWVDDLWLDDVVERGK